MHQRRIAQSQQEKRRSAGGRSLCRCSIFVGDAAREKNRKRKKFLARKRE